MKQDIVDIHKEIVESGKRGDSKAHQELYDLYAKAMFNICCRMMGDQAEAEDMLQEAFIEAFTNLDSFRYQSTFGAWLKRIVVNRCINQIKKRKIDMVFSDQVVDYEHEEERIINDDQIEYDVKRVYSAIEKLPEGYRVIFNLYMLEGYDHVEIAEIMGISESTSKSQYMRAKRKIKELLLLN